MGLYTLRTGATSHPEDTVLQLVTDLIETSGVLNVTSGDHFLVEAQASPDMTVKVNTGRAYIKGDTGNAYPIRLDADANVTITANSSGNPRIDVIVLYIDKSAAANTTASNIATLVAVAGTPAGSPTAPDDTAIQTAIGASNPYIILAEVEVANGASSITSGEITDVREQFEAVSDFANVTPASNNLYDNALINSCFDIAQLGTAFTSASTPANNDDTYLLDMWNLFSDGNDAVDVSQEATEVPVGATYSIKLDVETSKRFGIVQFLEHINAKKFKGKYVSLSFWVKSANISAIRAAVLSWGSTADAVTSDIVSSWAATPTWAANWTAENTPADLTVTSEWTEVKIENIYIDSATVNNLAVALWLPNEETIGDIIYISKVKLNEGAVATPYYPKPLLQELIDCQRFFEKSHNLTNAPTTAANIGAEMLSVGANGSNYVRGKVPFKVLKRTNPSIAIYDHAATVSRVTAVLQDTSESDNNSGYSIEGIGQSGFYFWFNRAGSYSGCSFQWVADARL